jgi:hypothetical protein
MTYDASNRKDIRKAEKAARLAERSRIDYTRRIMSEALGREWMHSLLLRCHVFHTSFVRAAPDQTAFNEGERNVGSQVFLDVVNHCPTEYVLMMQEASQKELINERHNSNDRSASSGQSAGGEDAGRDAEGPVTGEYDPFAPSED